jgi:hypothetical protein
MKDEAKSKEISDLLKVASNTALKIWLLSKPLKVTGIIIGLAALVVFLLASLKWHYLPLITLGTIGSGLIVFLAGLFVGKTILRIVRFRETFSQIIIGIAMALVGWILARIHLHIFDRLYLRKGQIKT